MRSSIQGLIPYDPGMTIEQLEQKVGKKIIKLSANESLWGPSPIVEEALQEGLTQLRLYPDGAAQALKKTLGKLWALPVESFCLGNGADEVIQMLAIAFLDPGEEVVVPSPTFSSYTSSVTIVGGKVTFVPQKELIFKLEEIAAYIHPGVKMVFLCNPNNPTGTFFSHTNLELFLQKVPPKTLVVLTEWAKNN
ncbi:MAG: aminotransferase class I/II-fold pyridoxal phosphate-dependent enzyme [Clostridia bacterium]|nr:aminotransferase class I/II-fold pyridoxal phosphate-dependent enzyme [Clostridia bacterium]